MLSMVEGDSLVVQR